MSKAVCGRKKNEETLVRFCLQAAIEGELLSEARERVAVDSVSTARSPLANPYRVTGQEEEEREFQDSCVVGARWLVRRGKESKSGSKLGLLNVSSPSSIFGETGNLSFILA
jgi:hypothetical protein